MATKLGDLTVGADGSWSSGPHTLASGEHSVTLRRKSDGAVLVTRGFTVAAGAVDVSDDFNRGTLGSNWGTPQSGNVATMGTNKIASGDGVYTAATFNANQYSETKYGTPLVRGSTSSMQGYYLAFVTGQDGEGYETFSVQVMKRLSTPVEIGSPFDLGYSPAGAVRRIEVSGSSTTTITVKIGATHGSLSTLGSVQDSSSPHTSGHPGFLCSDTNGVDDWYGGDL